MSLKGMMIHTCNIVRRTTARGSAGGASTTETTRHSNLACRARPLKPNEVAELAKDSVLADYKFYFVTNPGVDKRDFVEYTDPDENTLSLDVVSWYNPHDMGTFYKVFAQTIRG